MKKKRKSISYAKWGYFFILPFFLCYFIFSLIPLADTIRYSFFEYYRSGIKEIGPNFVGMQNYFSLLDSDMIKYGINTLILWVIGFIPQIVIALLLAVWFTDIRMKICCKNFICNRSVIHRKIMTIPSTIKKILCNGIYARPQQLPKYTPSAPEEIKTPEGKYLLSLSISICLPAPI